MIDVKHIRDQVFNYKDMLENFLTSDLITLLVPAGLNEVSIYNMPNKYIGNS